MRLKSAGNIILLTVILVTIYAIGFAQETVETIAIAVEGVSDSLKSTLLKDSLEAVLDVKLNAIQSAGVSVESVRQMNSDIKRQQWVDENWDAIILPDYKIASFGYGEDSLYYAAFFGRAYKGENILMNAQGNKKFNLALASLNNNKVGALEKLQIIVDEFGTCTSADDALLYLIELGDFHLRDERMEKLLNNYPDSPLIDSAKAYGEKYNFEPIKFDGMEFILIPDGITQKEDGYKRVSSFFIQKTEMTQAQYEKIMGKNPSIIKDPKHPVTRVSLKDLMKFLKKLNKTAGDEVYRLPTPDEWEYACRGGATTKYFFGDDDFDLKDYAWYKENSDRQANPSASKKPNICGLYDMLGGVWEWTIDSYDKKTEFGFLSGGSWNTMPDETTCSTRKEKKITKLYVDTGYRLIRIVKNEVQEETVEGK